MRLSCCLLTIFAAANAWGQTQPTRSSVENRANVDVYKAEASVKPEDKLNKADAKFIRDALENSRRENDLARLAITQASDPKIKSLGQSVMTEHAATNNALVAIATKGGVSDFMSVAKDYFSERAQYDARTGEKRNAPKGDISELSGAAFDKAFAKQMTERTQASIKSFEAAEKTTTNADLKNYVASTLPALRERLRQAQAIGK